MLNDNYPVVLTDEQLSTIAHIGADAVFRILLQTLPDKHAEVFRAVRDAQNFVSEELTRLYVIAEYSRDPKTGLTAHIPTNHYIRKWPK